MKFSLKQYKADAIEQKIQLREAEVAQEFKTKFRLPAKTQHATKVSFTNDNELIDSNITYDPSQKLAIAGLIKNPYGCITGAAGTGKTTVTKAVVAELEDSVSSVDMITYFKHDDMDSEQWVPAIALCAYTGRASEMIRKNFPRSWASNIMTIHRLLRYYPEDFTKEDENGEIVNSRRFVPFYTADNKLPWDVIIIDETGMCAVDLWHNLWAACKKGCRIYMVGDINQLPPVHGFSIYGFALAYWPSFELTKIHRQKGESNPIVENAWRVLQGEMPIQVPGFKMMQITENEMMASKQLRQIMIKLQRLKAYDPIKDTVILATNGYPGTRGATLGQIPINEYMALEFNPEGTRYLIDAGRDRKGFAIGDKVMVTRNDHDPDRQLTNGMTGLITSIEENPRYAGDMHTVGTIAEVNARLAEDKTVIDPAQLTAGLLELDFTEEKEKVSRGSASHEVHVQFDHAELGFSTFNEVAGLTLAYAITCHKSQGGEYPFVMILVHDVNKSMLYREWLYTAITRAQKQVMILYTPNALAGALRKQRIYGKTLAEKAQKFIALAEGSERLKPVLPLVEGGFL